MSKNFTRKNLPLAVLLASSLAAGNAVAQLEEVIVTAQKRTESLQDIPIAISAYDAQAIESMGLLNAKDIGTGLSPACKCRLIRFPPLTWPCLFAVSATRTPS